MTFMDRKLKRVFMGKLASDKSLHFSDMTMTIKDVLYLLGITYDDKKYSEADGFNLWKQEVSRIISPTPPDALVDAAINVIDRKFELLQVDSVSLHITEWKRLKAALKNSKE
jgi:hypothetical protein